MMSVRGLEQLSERMGVAMGVEYVNRKDDRYYLLQKATKTGKPSYYCSRKPKGTPVDAMPAGFEWRENPQTALVSVRRKLVSSISPQERECVERGVRELAELPAFIVDLEADALVIYTSDQSNESVERICDLLHYSPSMRAKTDWLHKHASYSAMLRFVLNDADERLYHADRWCFRGAVDDWIHLAGPAPLTDLVNEYVPHLGGESFFELY